MVRKSNVIIGRDSTQKILFKSASGMLKTLGGSVEEKETILSFLKWPIKLEKSI